MGEAMRIVFLPAADVRPLRQAVLRPHQCADELVYDGDALPAALHVGALDGADLIGVASISPEPRPSDPREGDWRLRGMATAPQARGRGVGAALLHAALDHARAHSGRRAWCNARMNVAGFYERAGFTVEGEPFELPHIGSHVVMVVLL